MAQGKNKIKSQQFHTNKDRVIEYYPRGVIKV